MQKDDQISTGLSPASFYEDSGPKNGRTKHISISSDEEDWEGGYVKTAKFRLCTRMHDKLSSHEEKIQAIQDQLYEDRDYLRCVSSQRNFAEYLIAQNIDMYEYLRKCNKEGILLDKLVNQYFKVEEKPLIKYKPLHCLKIHQCNEDQRLLAEIKNTARESKITRQDFKSIYRCEFEILDDSAEHEQRAIEKQRRLELHHQNNLLYMTKLRKKSSHTKKRIEVKIEESAEQYAIDLQPFGIPIDEDIIMRAVEQFKQVCAGLAKQFAENQPEEVEDSDASICVDYNDISDDSLEEHFKVAPNLRDKKYVSMNLYFEVTPISLQHSQLLVLMTHNFNPTYDHGQMKQKVGVSNLKMMDGEDLTAGDRRKLQQLQMKDWINQQTQEKEAQKRLQKQTQSAYDQQTLQINQARKELEEEQYRRRVEMEIANQQTNEQMAREKLDMEQHQEELAQREKKEHQLGMMTNDMWTENTATCQSQLAPHRVIPYHYKGMSDQQRMGIRQDQAVQRAENNQRKQNQQDDNKMWADYNEHNRKQLIGLEREKARKLESLRNNTKETNLLLAQEQKIKIKNQYN